MVTQPVFYISNLNAGLLSTGNQFPKGKKTYVRTPVYFLKAPTVNIHLGCRCNLTHLFAPERSLPPVLNVLTFLDYVFHYALYSMINI